MRVCVKYAIALVLCLPGVEARAELSGSMFDMRYIGHAEGLGSERVYSIAEDKYGAIWIATKAGVDRYNGQTVKNYNLPDDVFNGDMGWRRIGLLYDEQRDALWAWDNAGRVYRYSPRNDVFEQTIFWTEYAEEDVTLNKICFDNNGGLWLGMGSGLYRELPDGSITLVAGGQSVNDIICVGNWIFAGTAEGIFRLRYSHPDGVQQLMDGQDVQTLFYDPGAREVWIGTFNGGLWTMDIEGREARLVTNGDPGLLNPVRAIVGYDSATILVGVDGAGMYTVERATRQVSLLLSTEDSTEIALRGKGVYTMVRDRQGNIWVGSWSGGVSVAILSRYPITIQTHERHNTASPVNNNINDIEESAGGSLWYSTDDGVSVNHAGAGGWSHVLRGNVALTLCADDGERMWVGCYGGGIYILNSEGRIVRHLTREQGALTTNYIFNVKRDPDGDFYVAGLNGDLVLLDAQGRHKHTYHVGRLIHSIEFLGEGRVAVATVNGFCIVDTRSGVMDEYATMQELSGARASTFIVSMLFNDDNTVWIGTEGGGLGLYDMNSRTIRTFTQREGLPSDDVYSITRDTRGRLWVSTGMGLALIEDHKVSNLNYIGEIDKAYNKSAFAHLADGRFAYGSTDGAVFVAPAAIGPTNYQAPLRFTGMTVDYADKNEERLLRPRIREMLAGGDVRLDYRHNSFAVSFESINYRFQRDIAYCYILEGYDEQWSAPSPEGTVRYTKVAPGSYHLRVRTLRQSTGEVTSEAIVALRIDQPWWNSAWAWVLWICGAGAVFYFAWQYGSNRIHKKYNEEKVRFFIDTAHDIRTPISLIMAPLEDMDKQEELSARARSLLDLARKHTNKLHSLASRLLEFEKWDAGRGQVPFAPLDLGDMLREGGERFRSLCEKKGLHLTLSLPEEVVGVMGDGQMIEVMLDNLIYNACKYTGSGGEVALRLSAGARRVTIEIADSGIGIPKKDRKYLFRDIHRARNARESQDGGTGFGLLQVHRIVKMLRGRIAFRSEENRGTTFTVTLPRTTAGSGPGFDTRPGAVQENPRHTSGTNNEIGGGDKDTLLIVEDHEELRRYLRGIFEPDYRVMETGDGEQALAYLASEYPDLILSDLMMPGIQGDELCRMVKENPETEGIPFILLTAKASHESEVEGLKKGADDYIPKPFSTEILKLRVSGFIENRKRQRQYLMRQVARRIESGQTGEAVETSGGNLTDGSLSENDRNFVMRATEVVMENIANVEFSITALCREMAMSRTLFYSRLKSLTGQGPQEFIRIIRLQKAAELLKQGRSVTDVAIEAGFVNTKYFASLFKKHFGVQPSRYKS